MFYIYGADQSNATEKAENLLLICQQHYRMFRINEDYTIQQLQRIVPDATTVPQIFHGFKYIGGLKDLYDYLYTKVTFEDEENNDEQ